MDEPPGRKACRDYRRWISIDAGPVLGQAADLAPSTPEQQFAIVPKAVLKVPKWHNFKAAVDQPEELQG
jgi:hypothetical protein